MICVILFAVIALVMRSESAGATFGIRDQIFTAVLGVLIAGGLHLPARPRMRADAEAIRFRGYAGDWRTIPWSAVRAVEFPSNARFARITLPGDEFFALYAVQRADRDRAVATMRGLRELFAQSRAD